MAGVMMTNDEGTFVETEGVARIGGAEGASEFGLSSGSTTPVVKSAHVGFGDLGVRAEGVNYNTGQSIGVDVTTDAYPEGTRMSDSTPNDDIN